MTSRSNNFQSRYSTAMATEQKMDAIRELAEHFQAELEKMGCQVFLYVHMPEDLSRVFHCNFKANDPAFHYLRQAIDVAQISASERERWINVIIGTQQPFPVTCTNNIELEQFLVKGKKYIVISALHAIDGYCFVISDENGNYVPTPPGVTGFHSTRFELCRLMMGSN